MCVADLVAHDNDAALYLMFQLAGHVNSQLQRLTLWCATLCHILAQELKLPAAEQETAWCAALTMNIGVTAFAGPARAAAGKADAAAAGKPFKITPCKARRCWRGCSSQTFVLDIGGTAPCNIFQTGYRWNRRHPDRLTRILGTIDRYAAMIQPLQVQ